MAKGQQPIREKVTTIAEDGSRNFLRPASTGGRHTLNRRIVAFLLIAVYVLLPWIPVGGYPAVFLDVAERRFHLFGFTLAAQDVWILFFGITGLGFTLFFVTSLFGRLWCGWTCPQTVFMEHVFRQIERLFEGNHVQQRKLDDMPWGSEKLLRRGGKSVVFLLMCFIIAHIFLAYFVSIPELYQWMTHSPTEHWGAFMFMAVFTGILYFNFAWFREQLCLIICPYGRLQSALTDDDTLTITYDYKRGEPRGKATNPDNGDCINCNRCVQVCPTGIDIRQGLQIECIGCMSCIDACNEIMDKVDRPHGLIRYDSANSVEKQKRKFLRPRVFLYLLMMTIGFGVMTYSLSTISTANMSLVRMTGTPFFVADGYVRNQFNVRLINKLTEPATYKVTVNGMDGIIINGFESGVTVDPQQEQVLPLVIRLSLDDYTGPFPLQVDLTGEPGEIKLNREVEFLGPDPRALDAFKKAQQ